EGDFCCRIGAKSPILTVRLQRLLIRIPKYQSSAHGRPAVRNRHGKIPGSKGYFTRRTQRTEVIIKEECGRSQDHEYNDDDEILFRVHGVTLCICGLLTRRQHGEQTSNLCFIWLTTILAYLKRFSILNRS